MDNILVLDTSGSMSGRRIQELKIAVTRFIDLIDALQLGDRVSIVQFGGEANVVCEMTSDYGRLRRAVANLQADGGTPMAEGLTLGVYMLKDASAIRIGRCTLMPRILLMTDGAPNSTTDVLSVARQLGQLKFPISCVGVADCDQQLMSQIANITNGMFVMADDINLLQLFFIRQVFLIIYIQKMADDLEQLLNREILRAFLEEQSGAPVSDSELDGFIFLVSHLVNSDSTTVVVADSDEGTITNYRSSTYSTPTNTTNYRTTTATNNRTGTTQTARPRFTSHNAGCSRCCFNSRVGFIVLIWLLQLAIAGMSIYSAILISRGHFPQIASNFQINTFVLSAVCVGMIINCGCVISLTATKGNEKNCICWSFQLVAAVMMLFPLGIIFANIFFAGYEFVIFPSAIAIMALIVVCTVVVWIGQCCDKQCNKDDFI